MRHGPHHVAQKSTSTTRPRSDASERGALPIGIAPSNGGAATPTCSMRTTASEPGFSFSSARSVMVRPARTTTIGTTLDAGCDVTTRITCCASRTSTPSTETMRSPSSRLAREAGEPRTTCVTRTPVSASSMYTPSQPGRSDGVARACPSTPSAIKAPRTTTLRHPRFVTPSRVTGEDGEASPGATTFASRRHRHCAANSLGALASRREDLPLAPRSIGMSQPTQTRSTKSDMA